MHSSSSHSLPLNPFWLFQKIFLPRLHWSCHIRRRSLQRKQFERWSIALSWTHPDSNLPAGVGRWWGWCSSFFSVIPAESKYISALVTVTDYTAKFKSFLDAQLLALMHHDGEKSALSMRATARNTVLSFLVKGNAREYSGLEALRLGVQVILNWTYGTSDVPSSAGTLCAYRLMSFHDRILLISRTSLKSILSWSGVMMLYLSFKK